MSHTFHIPVLGLGFSVDTPLKVARYGINSVASVVDDDLIERMRLYHSQKNNLDAEPIAKTDPDARARRITAYLNLLSDLVDEQFEELKQQNFNAGTDLDRYFRLLPDDSPLKQGYELMIEYPDSPSKKIFQNILRSKMQKGSIDVNIMAKVDKMNFDADGNYTGDTNTDALAALRGFAESKLQSSLVLSAGMNPKLYSYLEKFDDFFPDEHGHLRKKIILKVSDYRSAFIQAKFLAKKGLWVSEFRIESGLNCGGHAFATDGLLMGPILEDFKTKRDEMQAELFFLYQDALMAKNLLTEVMPPQKISAQGGIGTAQENDFMLKHYDLDATGWGSPFLLVPEATNVDEETLKQLVDADTNDYYISSSSPLGILFNNFRRSSAERIRLERIAKGRPGSPCNKKFLVSNTEFTEQPICTASREYQNLKIKQLQSAGLEPKVLEREVEAVTEKVCLCEGLCASAFIKNDMLKPRESKAVTICPGPNLAYFSKIYTLDELIDHIYNRTDLLASSKRAHMFVNELNLYIDYLKKDISVYMDNLNEKKGKYLLKFKDQLQQGIAYYKQLIPNISNQTSAYLEQMLNDLALSEERLAMLKV
ncbi:hypothetical protein [Mucilaginibacter auburnensis]|uniref:Uncharacterized protein n=1 Tax=Mucilaginibacter auburnensis TaxID=1457233 RepID=A0A2H9VRU9_9SPHI|nr:hypothetical protein [Mucilaginibacter auburnensis]PJJ83544.1 hypothetical protein CLV57_0528 [Mucilaginibacter auburnensis]